MNIADYVQLKYKNEVIDTIWDLWHPVFTYPEMPEEKVVIDKEGNQIIEQPNEMKVFMWYKYWDRVKSQETEYKKYQKTVYTLIMGECSLALQAQLERFWKD